MENALIIANYFIKKSLDSGVEVTPMKALKLVYLAHGWYLGLIGQPLISEGVEAWQYGPVVPSVYDRFKGYGGKQITELCPVPVPGPKIRYYDISDPQLTEFLDKIWDVYKGFSGVELSASTHQEGTPWYKTWYGDGGSRRRNATIPNDLIKDHYKKLAEKNAEKRESGN